MNHSIILVISDELQRIALARLILQDCGYTVDEIMACDKHIVECISRKPDLIFIPNAAMDALPDGYTLCQQIRHHPGTRNVPIVMGAFSEAKVLAAGANARVSTIVQTTDLIQIIKEILQDER